MSGVQHREFSVQGSESSVQSPASKAQHPESSIQSPESNVQGPTSTIQRPESRVQRPESRTLACRVQEFRYAAKHSMICHSANFSAQNWLNKQSQKIKCPTGFQRKILRQTTCKTSNICSFKQFRCSLNDFQKFQCQKQPSEVFCNKGCLKKNLAKFKGKHLRQNLFFSKVAGLLKERLCHRCFPVNFTKFLRTPFLQNTSRRLLLQCVKIWFWDEFSLKNNLLGKALKPPLFSVLSSYLKHIFLIKKKYWLQVLTSLLKWS